jgi:hypothetical protein
MTSPSKRSPIPRSTSAETCIAGLWVSTGSPMVCERVSHSHFAPTAVFYRIWKSLKTDFGTISSVREVSLFAIPAVRL